MNKTENFYRFHIKVVQGAETLFTVRERKIEDSVVDFRYASADQVNSYHALKYGLSHARAHTHTRTLCCAMSSSNMCVSCGI
jgi:hypothetical protein